MLAAVMASFSVNKRGGFRGAPYASAIQLGVANCDFLKLHREALSPKPAGFLKSKLAEEIKRPLDQRLRLFVEIRQVTAYPPHRKSEAVAIS